jgi:hypothetical protein
LAAADLRPLATPAVVGALMGAFELNNLEVAVPALGASLENEEEEEEEGGEGGDCAAPGPSKRRVTGRRVARPPASPPPPRLAWRTLLAAAGGALPGTASGGSAFYPLQACANHSCEPTARAVPGAGTAGLAWVEEGGGGAGGGEAAAALPPPPAATARTRPRDTSARAHTPLPAPLAPTARPVDAVLVAAVDLAPGDEVTLCYVAEASPLAARAAALRDYGISPCACARCAREAADGQGRGGHGEAGEGEEGGVVGRLGPGLRRGSRGGGGGSGSSSWVGAWRA